MQCSINRQTNLFSVEIFKKEQNLSSKIQTVITTKIKPNSVGAEHLKNCVGYNGEDAEIWVFTAGDSSN